MIKLLLGWKGYAAAAVIAGVAAWTAQGWRYGEHIANLERDQAKEETAQAKASIDQLISDIDQIALAGRRAAAVGPALTVEINKLSGAIKNANPLPLGCRPDSVRVRSLTDSVRAANRAAAGQPTSGAVSGNP